MSVHNEGQREVEHPRRTPRRDQAEDGVGGAGKAGQVTALHGAEHREGDGIDRKRATEVGDDLVVSAPTSLAEPTVDKHVGHRGIEYGKV
jgi:hypothetical protein